MANEETDDSLSTDDETQPLPQEPQLQESSDDDESSESEEEEAPVVSTQESSSDESEEEEAPVVSTQESSSDDESSEHEEAPAVTKPSLQQPQQSQQQSEQQSEDDDSDSEETRNSSSAFIVKATLPKPGAKRPAESQKIDKSVSQNKKNKVSDDNAAELEKGKKIMSGDEEEKSIIKWTEKDEITLLDGMIYYKGEDVNSKTDAFYEYVRGLLSVDLKKNQLFGKIKRLKKKFQTNAEKFKSGEEPVLFSRVFSRAHENKLFELSQKVWGSVSDGNVGKKKDGIVVSKTNVKEIKDTIMEVGKEETKDYWLLYPRLCASLESETSGYLTAMKGNLKEHVKNIISGMSKDKARELEDGWKDIHLMDAQIYAKRAHLISKQADAVLDIFNLFQS